MNTSMCSDEHICFSYLKIYWVIEPPFLKPLWWIFCKTICVTSVPCKNTSEHSFLSWVPVLIAISFWWHLPCFAICEPFHLLLVSHLSTSVDFSDLEQSDVTSVFWTTFCFRIELRFMIHDCNCCDHSSPVFIYLFHCFKLCFAWKPEILPSFCSVITCRESLIERFFDLSCDFIDASDDDWIVFCNYFWCWFSFCWEKCWSTSCNCE